MTVFLSEGLCSLASSQIRRETTVNRPSGASFALDPILEVGGLDLLAFQSTLCFV